MKWEMRVGMLALILGVVLWIRPSHDSVLIYGLPGCLFLAWCMALRLGWRTMWFRWVWLLLPLLAAIPFLLPDRPIPVQPLRAAYLAKMGRLEGVRYVWGGENEQGVDCSGLPRVGIRGALLDQGWRTANGGAFREWARQWWFDASAKALGEGYRGYTRPLGISGVLREIDVTLLQPGDLAVTANGRHVMIYYGDGKWIQADPVASKVVIAKPAEYQSAWFSAEVSVHRWTLLW